MLRRACARQLCSAGNCSHVRPHLHPLAVQLCEWLGNEPAKLSAQQALGCATKHVSQLTGDVLDSPLDICNKQMLNGWSAPANVGNKEG
jgi:hypothetical protein